MNERRTMLPFEQKEVTLNKSSISVDAKSSTLYITVYYGEDVATDLTTSNLSNSNTSMMTYSVLNGVITLSILSQKGKTSNRSGIITVSYKGQTVYCAVSQSADFLVSTKLYSINLTSISASITKTATFRTQKTQSGSKYECYSVPISLSMSGSATMQGTYYSGYSTNNYSTKTFSGASNASEAYFVIVRKTDTGNVSIANFTFYGAVHTTSGIGNSSPLSVGGVSLVVNEFYNIGYLTLSQSSTHISGSASAKDLRFAHHASSNADEYTKYPTGITKVSYSFDVDTPSTGTLTINSFSISFS